MIRDSKIKYSALKLAIEVTLKGIQKNPQRCARNVVELITNAYPDIITPEQQAELYILIIESANSEEVNNIREKILLYINKKQ